ncbi:MAG: Gfo/Idh/MocA family oxidoreductase [Gemmatimonadota bacterium]
MAAEQKRYRVAVVGAAGSWGRNYLRAYAAHPRAEVVAIVDRARERRQAFADRYGVPAVYDEVEELLSREVPDIVSVILPVGISPQVVITCAEAGVRAISCEKPIAVRLEEADRMVTACRARGAALGCGTAHWEGKGLIKMAQWVRDGGIGRLTGAAIPCGLAREVSGSGCVHLTRLRLITGLEVEWVEGRVLPPFGWNEGWDLPGGGTAQDLVDNHLHLDCPAHGRLGLTGGITCDIPLPRESGVPAFLWVAGEKGQLWGAHPESVIIEGTGAQATPVFPEFLQGEWPRDMFTPVVERLMTAIDQGREAQCSGHDYRQALEVAVALVLSAQRGGERVELPLTDRRQGIIPRPYRLSGGDAVGWQKSGHGGPPQLPA